MGVSRSAARVARSRIVSVFGGEALGLGQADRFVRAHRDRAPESETTFVSGTKGRAFRGATLIRRCRTSVTDGPASPPPIGAALYRWRSAPEPTGACGLAASRSVRRLPGPFLVVAVPARTNRRISESTCDGYSSRSQPVLRDVAGSMAVARRDRQAWAREASGALCRGRCLFAASPADGFWSATSARARINPGRSRRSCVEPAAARRAHRTPARRSQASAAGPAPSASLREPASRRLCR